MAISFWFRAQGCFYLVFEGVLCSHIIQTHTEIKQLLCWTINIAKISLYLYFSVYLGCGTIGMIKNPTLTFIVMLKTFSPNLLLYRCIPNNRQPTLGRKLIISRITCPTFPTNTTVLNIVEGSSPLHIVCYIHLFQKRDKVVQP